MAVDTKSFLVKVAPLLLSLAALIAGFLVRNLHLFWVCDVGSDYSSCKAMWNNIVAVGSTLFFTATFVTPVALIAAFTNKLVLKLWARFSSIWLPVMFVLVLATPEEGVAATVFSFPYRLYVAILLGGLYVLISLILMGWKSYAIRKKS